MANLSFTIDLNKISEKRIRTKDKNGNPYKDGARYLDLVLIETPNSKHDTDFMISESVTKEERAQKKWGAVLGNGKYFGSARQQPRTQQDNRSAQPSAGASDVPPEPAPEGDDVPF